MLELLCTHIWKLKTRPVETILRRKGEENERRGV
jgi:hypothetical protein